jgi:hypothetical protein
VKNNYGIPQGPTVQLPHCFILKPLIIYFSIEIIESPKKKSYFFYFILFFLQTNLSLIWRPYSIEKKPFQLMIRLSFFFFFQTNLFWGLIPLIYFFFLLFFFPNKPVFMALFYLGALGDRLTRLIVEPALHHG